VRGDNFLSILRTFRTPGSPPRAWGQRIRGVDFESVGRFTPTCVGTTSRSTFGQGWRPVHPHVRGDNLHVGVSFRDVRGSPPRAWGQPRGGSWLRAGDRFTPTCVGTTASSPSAGVVVAVHPHVRGDNLNVSPIRYREAGSPPRAWGQLYATDYWVLPARFTPTCVGTTEGFDRGCQW